MQHTPESCVFCSETQLQQRIVGETPNFRIVATLGQISNGGYLLLIPKQHVHCMASLEEDTFKELRSAIALIRHALLIHYNCLSPLIFEHGIVGQTVLHAHLHFVPEVGHITERIRTDFPLHHIDKVDSFAYLKGLYQRIGTPYLLWQDPGTCFMKVCWNPPAPPMYLRQIAAETIRRPERGNWRTMDPELDQVLGEVTVNRLRPVFHRA